MSYGLMNEDIIYSSKQCNVVEQAFVYEKAYPSEALKPIVFHALDDVSNMEDNIKAILHDYGTTDIPDDQNFTLNLQGVTIGNFFFAGLVYDSMNKHDEFFKDLRSGRVQLALINIDKADGHSGILVLDLLHLCKEIKTPVIHIFISSITAMEVLDKINDQLGSEYFIKYGNEVFND